MTDIDYEALAKAAASKMSIRYSTEDIARAVVADYIQQQREQGMVEVRAEDLVEAIAAINGDSDMPWDSLDRLEAARAARPASSVVLD